MKKIIAFLLSFFLIININTKTYAAETPPDVLGEGIVLMEAKTGTILYSKNPDEALPPASTTKIMTALLVLEKSNLSDKVTIGKNPPKTDGTALGLVEGETVTVEDLLNTLLIGSCNDSAVALAEYISGSEDKFAKLMTERAKELGATNTNFVNASGLYDENHKISANDMALIMREAIKHPEFLSITEKPYYVIKNTDKVSTERWVNNRIMPLFQNSVYYYEPTIAGKTGYTIQAKHSVVTAAQKNGMSLIAVILHTDDKNRYFPDSKSLYEYGFNNFKLIKLFSKGDKIDDFIDDSGTSIPLLSGEDFYYVSSNEDSSKSPEVNIDKSLIATKYFNRGDKISTASISLNGKNIGTVPVISGGTREKALSAFSSGISSIKENLNSRIIPFICTIAAVILLYILLNFKKWRRQAAYKKKFKRKRNGHF